MCSKFDISSYHSQYIDALKLCNEQNVMLTEDLVEKLTPEKSDDNESEADRLRVLEAIATVCMNQRQYHLATKKYTQAGNRIKVIPVSFNLIITLHFLGNILVADSQIPCIIE